MDNLEVEIEETVRIRWNGEDGKGTYSSFLSFTRADAGQIRDALIEALADKEN